MKVKSKDDAESIVATLAAADPTWFDNFVTRECVFCEAEQKDQQRYAKLPGIERRGALGTLVVTNHTPDCPWLRAHLYMKAKA